MKSNSINKSLKLAHSQSGFSLIEILIALALLAGAGTFVAGKIFDQLYEGQVESTKIQMSAIADRLKEFRRHCGSYPTTEQGLNALLEKPAGDKDCKRYNPGGYIEGGQLPKDPWDEDFIYESDGRTFNMFSLGQDRTEGGEDKDADIYLYDKKEN